MDQLSQSPQNSHEQLPAPVAPGETLPGVSDSERVATNPERAERLTGAPSTAQASDDVAAIAVPASQTQVGATPVAPSDDTALASDSDIDVIEKEWVEKAKSIVATTKDDPRRQSAELSGMKREYIKKRFGKTLPDNQAA